MNDNWQPIETAPRNEIPVLVWAKDLLNLPNGGYAVARRSRDFSAWFLDNGRSEYLLRGPAPTHWRPLPAPPGMGSWWPYRREGDWMALQPQPPPPEGAP